MWQENRGVSSLPHGLAPVAGQRSLRAYQLSGIIGRQYPSGIAHNGSDEMLLSMIG